ncbi:hypothetical protein [Aminivibrio sp.]|uniref:hypothetical protein n=1 Tax=Aminivibrio sp. TaxID=1872489 RepID=UPI0025BF3510|nr:hypothetical protein [Aminivibrio sp.]
MEVKEYLYALDTLADWKIGYSTPKLHMGDHRHGGGGGSLRIFKGTLRGDGRDETGYPGKSGICSTGPGMPGIIMALRSHRMNKPGRIPSRGLSGRESAGF